MADVTWDFRTYRAEAEELRLPPLGTPVYGVTTGGEPFTLYVTEVTDEGVRIGPEKPEPQP